MHNVADAPKRKSVEERQPPLKDSLRAGVAAAWQPHLFPSKALQVPGNQSQRIGSQRSLLLCTSTHCGGRSVSTTLLRSQLEQSLVSKSEASRAHLRSAEGRLTHASTDLLQHGLPEDSTEGDGAQDHLRRTATNQGNSNPVLGEWCGPRVVLVTVPFPLLTAHTEVRGSHTLVTRQWPERAPETRKRSKAASSELSCPFWLLSVPGRVAAGLRGAESARRLAARSAH